MLVPSTIWTQIRAAQRNSTGAWDRMYLKYQGLVSRQISRRIGGLSESDLEDLRQNVFLEISRPDFLQRADKSKGRFRSLLFAVTDNVIKMWLRGEYSRRRKGPNKTALIDQEAIFGALQNREAPSSPEEEVFNREWAGELLQESLDSLKAESDRLQTKYHRTVIGHYFEKLSRADLAKEMDITEDMVRNYLSRGRQKLGESMRAAIAEYCTDEQEILDELDDLKKYIPIG